MTHPLSRLSARLLIVFVAVAAVLPAATANCSDFLARLQMKPAHLEFVECQHKETSAGDTWVATYKVPGNHAVQVEDFLSKNVHLKKLVKSCCQWDGPVAFYRKGDDLFNISMTSDEETPSIVTTSRADWHKLPFFYVTVQFYKAD